MVIHCWLSRCCTVPFNLCQKHEQQKSLGKNSTSAGGLGLGWSWLVIWPFYVRGLLWCQLLELRPASLNLQKLCAVLGTALYCHLKTVLNTYFFLTGKVPEWTQLRWTDWRGFNSKTFKLWRWLQKIHWQHVRGGPVRPGACSSARCHTRLTYSCHSFNDSCC